MIKSARDFNLENDVIAVEVLASGVTDDLQLASNGNEEVGCTPANSLLRSFHSKEVCLLLRREEFLGDG